MEMETRINTIDREISKDGLADVCTGIHYTFYIQKEKTTAVAEVLYKNGDELPEGKKVGDVKTEAVPATYYSASIIGVVGLDTPDSDKFIAYADITEAKAKDWCEAKIGEDQLKIIEASLDAQIAEKEATTRGTGRPWASQMFEAYGEYGITAIVVGLFNMMILNLIKSQRSQNDDLDDIRVHIGKMETKVANSESIVIKLIDRIGRL